MNKKQAFADFNHYCNEESINIDTLKYIRDIDTEEMNDFSKIDNGWICDAPPKDIESLMVWYNQGFCFTSCEIAYSQIPCVILQVQDDKGGYICISKEIWHLVKPD